MSKSKTTRFGLFLIQRIPYVQLSHLQKASYLTNERYLFQYVFKYKAHVIDTIYFIIIKNLLTCVEKL